MSENQSRAEAVARAIYDELEGPVANQDFSRQARQWELAQRLAKAAIAASPAPPSAEALPAGVVWFEFDEGTGEFTGKYSTVKPHDARGMVPFVRAALSSAPAQEDGDKDLGAHPRDSGQNASSVESGWLAELTGASPSWAVLNPRDYDDHWTTDSTKAIRFARREDAQAYIDHIGWTAVVPTEHIWDDGRRAIISSRVEMVARIIHASPVFQPAHGPWREDVMAAGQQHCMKAARAILSALESSKAALADAPEGRDNG